MSSVSDGVLSQLDCIQTGDGGRISNEGMTSLSLIVYMFTRENPASSPGS